MFDNIANNRGLEHKTFSYVVCCFDTTQHTMQGLCLLTQLILSSYKQSISQIHHTVPLSGEITLDFGFYCCIVFFLLPSLFCCSTLSFCAQPSVLPKSCRFFTTVFSASPPTLGASFCAKTILRTHDVVKSVRVLPSWATSLRQYYDLCNTPADQFSRVSNTARQRRDRCQTQVSEISNVWIEVASSAEAAARRRSLALKKMNSRHGKISRFSMCFALCGTNI